MRIHWCGTVRKNINSEEGNTCQEEASEVGLPFYKVSFILASREAKRVQINDSFENIQSQKMEGFQHFLLCFPAFSFSSLLSPSSLPHFTMKSPSRSAGPRAMLKNQSYREIAEQKMEAEREKTRINQNDSPIEALETIAQSAQSEANARIFRQSCLNVSSEDDLKKMPGKTSHAVTYWSHSHKPLIYE